jgi:hypothetical protein
MVVLIRVMTRLSGLEGFGLIALQVAVGGLAYCALALPWLLKRFRKLR